VASLAESIKNYSRQIKFKISREHDSARSAGTSVEREQ
jgi:hypothetical protein